MDDPVITPTLLRDYRDRFSDFQLVTVDGVGHWIVEERPELVLDRLRPVLQDYAGALDAEGAFTGLSWSDAKNIAAAVAFDLTQRDDAQEFIAQRPAPSWAATARCGTTSRVRRGR